MITQIVADERVLLEHEDFQSYVLRLLAITYLGSLDHGHQVFGLNGVCQKGRSSEKFRTAFRVSWLLASDSVLADDH